MALKLASRRWLIGLSRSGTPSETHTFSYDAGTNAVGRLTQLADPAATEAQVLAARAHHLRRWVVPRTSYPEGRAGYLRWRTDQKRRQGLVGGRHPQTRDSSDQRQFLRTEPLQCVGQHMRLPLYER